MKKFKLKKNGEEDYWKSFTDIMAGLLLVVILVMALLFLYLTQVEWDRFSNEGGRGGATADSRAIPTMRYYHPTEYPRETYHHEENNSGGNNNPKPTEYPTEPPTEGGEDIGKAAVYVTVVDEETGNAIKKAGITFELYTDENRRGGLKKLNTYYPEKIEYEKYETTEDGTFYLPEKLSYHTYSLHNLIAPEQYGSGEDVNFEIKAPYDWPEPYLLKVPLAPAKNTIRVQMKDSQSGEPVQGYKYEVIANEDIVTLDGTLRYSKDQIVDEFTCNEKGYGESIKLYLGTYRIRQKSSPEYYALDSTPLTVKVESNADVDTPINQVICDKSAFEISLRDEYTEDPIADAVYALKNGDEFATDATGSAVLTDLSKETTYELTVKSLPDHYKTNEQTIRFRVDENGLIDSEARHIFEHTAYVTRVTVSVRDMFLRKDLTGENVTLFDENDSPVAQLDTNGTIETITGLEPGVYTVKSGNKDYTKRTVRVEDKAKPTEAFVYIWTYVDFAIIFVFVLLLAAAAVAVTVIIRKKKVKKTDANREAKG